MSFTWTEERIATLTKMWESGATASQIADELGGVSRNAVIGKAHRLGLKARPSPVKANEPKPAAKPAPVDSKPIAKPVRPKAPVRADDNDPPAASAIKLRLVTPPRAIGQIHNLDVTSLPAFG